MVLVVVGRSVTVVRSVVEVNVCDSVTFVVGKTTVVVLLSEPTEVVVVRGAVVIVLLSPSELVVVGKTEVVIVLLSPTVVAVWVAVVVSLPVTEAVVVGPTEIQAISVQDVVVVVLLSTPVDVADADAVLSVGVVEEPVVCELQMVRPRRLTERPPAQLEESVAVADVSVGAVVVVADSLDESVAVVVALSVVDPVPPLEVCVIVDVVQSNKPRIPQLVTV